MGYRGQSSFQNLVPLTPAVKRIVALSVGIWFFLQVIVDQLIIKQDFMVTYFGLSPAKFILQFNLWQPITYIFIHSLNPTHILFNMLLLWWLGSELESRWGARFFTTYYLVCGVGAGILYVLVSAIYWAISGNLNGLLNPVIGASGAVFGLMLAYGIVFGERIVSFMFLFQMKAKYFVMILAMVEVVLIINNGIAGSPVANLAHLGGFITGFLFLSFWTRYQSRRRQSSSKDKGGRHLRIVVNNDGESKDSKNPKFWQ